MKEILIAVKNKIAMNLGNATYVCDNSDYKVVFDFDGEWEEHPVKTARFKYNGVYQEVVFTGNECPVPLIQDARLIQVGVYAGALQTSTPAVIHASQSILSGDAAHEEPAEDVYNQLVELVESGMLQGPQGDPGPQGPQGEPGPAGRDGVDGKDGADGVDGKDGAPGLDGADGKTPVFGVDYGTPEQISGIAQQAAEVLRPDVNQLKDDLSALQAGIEAKESRYIIKTVMDSVATPHTQYYLGDQTAVDIVLPDTAEVGQIITVCWYNGATAATLSITGTMLDFDFAPSENARSEINALWDGAYWAVIGHEMAVV